MKSFYQLIVLWTSFAVYACDDVQPNIVLVFVDDFGYGDLQSYGHPTQEKGAVDKLAEEGIRFTQWYSAASVCTPSRAALLTGKLPVRMGIYGNKKPVFLHGDSGGLPKSETTLAEALKDVGYETGMVGKWHLGINEKVEGDGNHLPSHHGFDFVGTLIPFTHDWPCDPRKFSVRQMKELCFLYYNDTLIEQPYDPTKLTENLVNDAKDFIRENHRRRHGGGDDGKPFFLYYSLPQTHTAMMCTEKFCNSSRRGPYGDNVNEMAWAVGEIIDLVKELDIEKNTFVLFISDHGPQVELCGHGGSTGVLKGQKLTAWEGGLRVPAIAWWPGKIPKGIVNTEVVSSLDVYETLLDIAGSNRKNTGDTSDGTSIKNLLLGLKENSSNFHEILYFYCNDLLTAVRIGRYKIHYFTRFIDNAGMQRNCGGDLTPLRNIMANHNCKSMTKHDPPLIYNLNIDPGERFRLDPKRHHAILAQARDLVEKHRRQLIKSPSQFDTFDPQLRPCCNPPSCVCLRSNETVSNVATYTSYKTQIPTRDEL